MPKWSRSMLACVPFPLPGAPYRTRFIVGRSSEEASVLAHHQLGLQLFHRVEGDAHDDEYGGASEIHLLMRDARDLRGGDGQDDGDEPQERGAGECHTVHDRSEIVRGRTSRADSRDEG